MPVTKRHRYDSIAVLIAVLGLVVAITAEATADDPQQVLTFCSGFRHSCAVVGDRVKCWGIAHYAMVGESDTAVHVDPPAFVPGLQNVTSLACGRVHTCAIVNGGEVFCWGHNDNGELGDGTIEHKAVPTRVPGLVGRAVSVRMGEVFACAVVETPPMNVHRVFCWGDNRLIQFKSRPRFTQPVLINGQRDVVEISQLELGQHHGCILVEKPGPRHVRCWGDNQVGQLGNARRFNSASMTRVVKSAAYKFTRISSMCGFLPAKGIMCWGPQRNFSDPDSQLDTIINRRPVAWPGFQKFKYLDKARMCAIIVETEGNKHQKPPRSSSAPVVNNKRKVVCYGPNYEGQLGDGSTNTRFPDYPGEVLGLPADMEPVEVSEGLEFRCVLMRNATASDVYCWGSNSGGKLGINRGSLFESLPARVLL